MATVNEFTRILTVERLFSSSRSSSKEVSGRGGEVTEAPGIHDSWRHLALPCPVQAQCTSPGLLWASQGKDRWRHESCIPGA